MRTLFAASGGGHLTQLFNLQHRLPFELGEVTWFTFDTPQSRSMLEGERVVWAHPAPPRDWRAALRNRRLAAAMCRRLQFTTAVSTGASVAVSTLPTARRHGTRAIYIESAARVEGPSLSGRILAATPGVETFCQYRSWAGGAWSYAGSVFDAFEAGPQRQLAAIRNVVVTLGSQEGYAFDRLVERLVDVLPADAEVVWQTGATDTTRFGVEGIASMPASELETAIAGADLVVAHAGVGSALASVIKGVHPVLVPRSAAAGEHVDDHQVQIAAELAGRGLATCATPSELDLGLLESAAHQSVMRRVDTPPLDIPG